MGNPVKDILKLTNASEIAEVSVWNLSGSRIYSGVYGNGVDVSAMNAGCYIVKVNTKANGQISQVFVKE